MASACKMDDLYRGNSRGFTADIEVEDDDGVITIPNITNDDVILTVKEDKAGVAVLTITNGPGDNPHSDPTNGITSFEITSDQSLLFTAGKVHYVDITWILSTGEVFTVQNASMLIVEPIRTPV